MSDELISKKALIERLNDILFFSDKGADDPWRNGIRRARTVVEEAAPAELSALRAAQPLTPCPTNHSLSKEREACKHEKMRWLDVNGNGYLGKKVPNNFCPDCGALLDSLADGL